MNTTGANATERTIDTKKARRTGYTTVSLRPYKMLCTSVHVRLYYMLAVLLAQGAALFLARSWASLSLLVCTVLAAELAESSELLVRKLHRFNWLQALRTGLVVGLLLPCTYEPVAAFVVTLAVSLVCKHLLGGEADSWVNTPALAVAVCWLVGMRLFPAFPLTEELLQAKNAAQSLMQDGVIVRQPFDGTVTAFLNRTLYGRLGASVPEGYVSLLWDSGADIPAFRFNLLTLLSSILLISADVISPLVPALQLAVYLLLVRLVSPLFYGGAFGQGDMLLALLSSGTLFCTMFLLQWVGTAPLTRFGKVCYGVVAGVFSFLIVGCGMAPVGFVFTVLVMNVISPLIQGMETLHGDRFIQAVLVPRNEALQKDGINA